MRPNHGFACLLLGHKKTEYETTFNKLGRHVEVKRCERCGEGQEIAFTGPIFPGEAEDPEKAVRVIENTTDREVPEPGDPVWDWNDDEGGLDAVTEEAAEDLLEQMEN